MNGSVDEWLDLFMCCILFTSSMEQGLLACFGFVTMVAFYGAFISVAMFSSSVEQNVMH